ncbi:hypothetical protein AKO1_007980, partial [Acrasis kona]
MDVTITGYSKHEDDTGKPFVIYHIKCVYNKQEWEVQRRYSEFHNLHKGLSRYFDQSVIGKFPSKLLFGNFKDDNLAKRTIQLQQYLSRILASDATVDYPDVGEFLNFKQNVTTNEMPKNARSELQKEARATRSHKGQDDSELSYNVDDVIVVTQQSSDGWWFGHLKQDPECNGLVEEINLKIVGQDNPNQNNNQTESNSKVALYDYEADGEGETSITSGDQLTVLKVDSDKEGWTLIHNLSTQQKGWVPTEYI